MGGNVMEGRRLEVVCSKGLHVTRSAPCGPVGPTFAVGPPYFLSAAPFYTVLIVMYLAEIGL